MVAERPGRRLLVALKASVLPGAPVLTIPVGRPVTGLLRPVATQPERLDPDDVARMTAWRNRFPRAFLTEFHATREQTGRWLAEVVGPSDRRIPFMVDDASGRTVGQMGLASINWEHGSFEVDGIVRGEDAPRGLMSAALRNLIGWAQGQLGLNVARVRVLADNPALTFYQRLGFRECHRTPLRRVVEPTVIRWVEGPAVPGDARSLVHMTWPNHAPHADVGHDDMLR